MKSENNFKLGGHVVGDGAPTFIVMEVAQAHEGSLGQAHAFIDLAAAKGADAVKFQTHIATAESTAREEFRVKFSYQDATRYDYWKRMEFSAAQWAGLRDHAVSLRLEFLSSPFSVEAVGLLEELGVPAWKLGSGEVLNQPLLDAVLRTGKPVLLSSGMSTWRETDAAVERIRAAGVPLLVYQCTSKYPAVPEEVGLNLLPVLRSRYGCAVGLSDHSGDPCFGIAAVALGASSVEVHMTMSPFSFGPDVKASLTPEKLGVLVDGIRKVKRSLGMPVAAKDAFALANSDLRILFGRSVVAREDLPAGTVLSASCLAVKKPGGGVAPDGMAALIGRHLRHAVGRDQLIRREDVEE